MMNVRLLRILAHGIVQQLEQAIYLASLDERLELLRKFRREHRLRLLECAIGWARIGFFETAPAKSVAGRWQ